MGKKNLTPTDGVCAFYRFFSCKQKKNRICKALISDTSTRGTRRVMTLVPEAIIPIFLAFFLSLSVGCARQNPTATIADLKMVAGEQSLVVHTLHAPPFSLVALSPQSSSGPVLRIYIEGDGRAWITRSQLSADPTPAHPLALVLMKVDGMADKAYLARPCQYLQTEACANEYWSERRFSPEVIKSMNDAMDQLKSMGKYQSLELVGYSGGGTMALLLAAHRDDIHSIRTIAGNLDHKWLNEYHHVTPLAGSLNPPDFADHLASIPQQHFVGEDDLVVPVGAYQSYRRAFQDTGCLGMTVVSGADHGKGWKENWQHCLEERPVCRH